VTQIVLVESPSAMAEAAGARLAGLLARAQHQYGEAVAALSGGSAALSPLASSAFHAVGVDPVRLDLWWADERHVPRGHDDRNDAAALSALGETCPPEPRLHRVAGAETTLEAAASDYDERLAAWVQRCTAVGRPALDVVLLGVGTDGHVASLFPGRAEVRAAGLAVAVADSPKPPPGRVSLTLTALRQADEVWLLATGAAKAAAVAAALGGDVSLPAAMVRGRRATRWFLDTEAGAQLTR
jgi:6-phosphogluconolactonase